MAKPKAKVEQAEQEARLKQMGTLENINKPEVIEIVETSTVVEEKPIEEGGKKDARLRRSNTNKPKNISTGARDN